MPPAIRVEELRQQFDGVRALDGLSFEAPDGGVFGFLGPNGAGKTTTIHILLGLLEPTGGRATVLGLDTRADADGIRSQTGALLEHTGLYEQLSAEQNLEFYGRVWRMPRDERARRTHEVLERFGLLERRTDRVVTWSRGMKQKLALARALLHRPRLLFLDEPTAGLDVVAAAAVREELARIAEQDSVTIFLTTHNMAEAERLCRRIGVVHRGRLVALGDPAELRARGGGRVEIAGKGLDERARAAVAARPGVAAADLRDGALSVRLAADGEVAPLVRLLVEAGVDVEEVRRDTASLEEVFLALVKEEGEPS